MVPGQANGGQRAAQGYQRQTDNDEEAPPRANPAANNNGGGFNAFAGQGTRIG